MIKSIFILFSLISLPVLAGPNGKILYEYHCESCHQTHGEGGIGLPLLAEKMMIVSDQYLENTIRQGRPGRIMPAYDDFSDAQVQAIIRYVRSWAEYPLLTVTDEKISGDLVNGEKIYKKKCAKCHADDGSGEGKGTGVTKSRERRFMVMPAAINNRGYLSSATDTEIKKIILADREESKMPSMQGKLEDQEVNDVVAFVRNFQTRIEAEPVESDEQPISLVVESPNDFETTVASARQALTGSNFRIFPDRFLEEGLIDEFSHNTRQVNLRFCNFQELYDLLNTEPRLGVILPCRITIMEQADGKVLLVAPNMKIMASWFNNDELAHIAEVMEETINAVIEEATF